jgi:hypothetical protein
MYIYSIWPWKVPKWPWFWAKVVVKAWRDLAKLPTKDQDLQCGRDHAKAVTTTTPVVHCL